MLSILAWPQAKTIVMLGSDGNVFHPGFLTLVQYYLSEFISRQISSIDIFNKVICQFYLH